MEVVTRAAMANVFDGLSLPLFFCLLLGSCAAPLDVLQVLLLFDGCLVPAYMSF